MMIRTDAAWHNEPAQWEWDTKEGRLTAVSLPQTDFWRKTRSGFIAENGHFYGVPVHGDFIAQVKVAGQFNADYDQAGLMLWLDATTWLKAGLEFVEGACYVSTVLTRDFSDWAIGRQIEASELWLRVERDREAIIVSASSEGQAYFPVRECTLTNTPMLEVGPYLASPTGDGFQACFEGLGIYQPRRPAHR